MVFRKDIRLLLLAFFQSYLCFCQIGSIQGTVTDSSNRETIPFVEVTLKGTEFKAQTDFDGVFKLKEIPVGVYTLCLTYVGYYNVYKKIAVTNNEELNLSLAMCSDKALSNDREIISFPVFKLEEDSTRKNQYEAFIFYWTKCTRTDSVDVKVVVQDSLGQYINKASLFFDSTGKQVHTDDKGGASFTLVKSNTPAILNLSYLNYSFRIKLIPNDCQSLKITLK